MDLKTLQSEIIRLKEEKGFCILAHSYVSEAVKEIADFTGDSYALSVKAKGTDKENILMCGVRFMAETAKLLSPDKKVFLSRREAGCPMAEQMTKAEIEKFRRENPDHTVVAYINTTAELKTVCDVCVTSSSAVKIVNKIENKNIYFIPDPNLGSYVKKCCPEKNIKLFNGGCPIHGKIKVEEARNAKEMHPEALLLVHPECVEEITKMADFVGSTAGILDFAKKSDAKEFIIGTENAITEELKMACPEKRFYELSSELICPDMKLTTLPDVYACLMGYGGEEIVLDEDTMKKAHKCIDEMIRLGG